jgi:hypothetical protein
MYIIIDTFLISSLCILSFCAGLLVALPVHHTIQSFRKKPIELIEKDNGEEMSDANEDEEEELEVSDDEEHGEEGEENEEVSEDGEEENQSESEEESEQGSEDESEEEQEDGESEEESEHGSEQETEQENGNEERETEQESEQESEEEVFHFDALDKVQQRKIQKFLLKYIQSRRTNKLKQM